MFAVWVITYDDSYSILIFRGSFIHLESGPSWQIHVWIQIFNFQTLNQSMQRKMVFATISKVRCPMALRGCHISARRSMLRSSESERPINVCYSILCILQMGDIAMHHVLINIFHLQITKPRKVFIKVHPRLLSHSFYRNESLLTTIWYSPYDMGRLYSGNFGIFDCTVSIIKIGGSVCRAWKMLSNDTKISMGPRYQKCILKLLRGRNRRWEASGSFGNLT